MAGYRLTSDADEDFADIYRYSVQTFGLLRADEYAVRLIEGFELLAKTRSPAAIIRTSVPIVAVSCTKNMSSITGLKPKAA